MRKFLVKGGYGEHGRSCFLVEYGTEGHFYMVDCGIMDSDSQPYPEISREELEQTDYLFLTHCHKDHSGAFGEMVKRGFHGVLVTSGMTAQLSGISYPQTVLLEVTDHDPAVDQTEIGPFFVHYGRSGHCPGGLWFLIEDDMGKCLFTGDYQENTLAYACDPIKNCTADLAVVDCAHRDTMEAADGLRKQMKDQIRNFRNLGQKILFPLPHYGRGCEILFLLDEMKRDERAGWRIAADQRFIKDLETVLAEELWYQEEVYEQLKQIYEELRQSYQGKAEPEKLGYLSDRRSSSAKRRKSGICESASTKRRCSDHHRTGKARSSSGTSSKRRKSHKTIISSSSKRKGYGKYGKKQSVSDGGAVS